MKTQPLFSISSTLPLFILTVLLFFLSSCQSPPKINCSELNWREVGKDLALQGTPKKSGLVKLKKTCRQKDHLYDENAFNDGYSDGIKVFCQIDNGFRLGQSGKVYNETCKNENEDKFITGYIKGRLLFLKEELNKNTKLYGEAQDRFWRKEREYTLIMNEDPEQAKLQKDVLEAYEEETRSLKEKIELNKKELSYYKKKNQEIKFN